MNRLTFTLSLTLFIPLICAGADTALLKDSQLIIEKNESAQKIKNLTAQVSLTNFDSNTDKKVKTFTWWRKLSDNNTTYKTLTRFLTPADIKDEAILFLENKNAEADILIYLPAYKKVRRVENQAQNSGFMGSLFTYADMASYNLSDYNYKLLSSEECHNKGTCYVIEATPSSEAIKERTGYAKQLKYIRTDNFMLSKVRYFDKNNKAIKELMAFDTNKIDANADVWFSHRLEMRSLSDSKKTSLNFSSVNSKQEISDNIFTQRSLLK